MHVLISSAAPGSGLGHELGVGEEGPGHGDQVGLTSGQDLLGELGGVDAVGGAHRDAELGAEPGGGRSPGPWWDLGDDRGHPGLVPPDAGVEDVDAGLLQGLGESDDFLPGLAVLDQVEQ